MSLGILFKAGVSISSSAIDTFIQLVVIVLSLEWLAEEALRLAAVAGDQGCYARAVRIAGDVYRRKCDIGKALRHYEVAMGAGQALGDRLAQMEAMDGAARCLDALRLQGRICNCRPLEFNTRLLEVATSVGAKHISEANEQANHHSVGSAVYKHSAREELPVRCQPFGANLQFSDASSSRETPPSRHIHGPRREGSGRKAEKGGRRFPPSCARCRRPLSEDNEPRALAALPCAHIVHHDWPQTGKAKTNCNRARLASVFHHWQHALFKDSGTEVADSTRCAAEPDPSCKLLIEVRCS
ncbi:hypothetical protein EVAR_14154_1 [Eumeta japonica]|uniref:Uncharacterized protein n=1 Tax=Eumeta variegata TaxID=151549 RepID=A0A4C1UEE2_EUMVA|nr:hypothetical protein EVAR_14154_1 [Eumeta japonica]